MSLPQPQCDRCQSPLSANGRCALCAPAAPLTALTGARPRSVDPGNPPTPSAPDDNWDVVLSDAPERRSLESMPGEEGLGTLAFERAPDGSIRPIARDPAPAPEPPPPPPPPSDRLTVGFLGAVGSFAIPPPRILTEPPTDVFPARSTPRVMILGAGKGDAPGERITPQTTLAFQRDLAAPVAPLPAAPVAPPPAAPAPHRGDVALAATLAFEARPADLAVEAAVAPVALANSVPANDAAPAPAVALPAPAVAPAVALPAPAAPATPAESPISMQVTALAGGAALLVSGLLSAPTGATDTVAFLLAGGALLATTVSEMSPLQRAWASVAVGLPLLVLEVGANPMLPGLAAALAALVVAALGGALSLRARLPAAALSRDALAGAVVACAAWMMAPGAGGLADASRAAGPAGWVAPLMLPGLLVGLAALAPAVARRAAQGLVAAPALWCAALPFLQALDLSLPTAATQLIAAHALAALAAVAVTSLALSAVVEGHAAQA